MIETNLAPLFVEVGNLRLTYSCSNGEIVLFSPSFRRLLTLVLSLVLSGCPTYLRI